MKKFILLIIVIAVAIGSDGGEQAIDWRKGDLSNVPHSAHCLPDEISEKSVALVRTFGLHYGAIDFILTPDNRYVFLELNPEGLWGWLEVLTEVKITERIVDEMLRLQR